MKLGAASKFVGKGDAREVLLQLATPGKFDFLSGEDVRRGEAKLRLLLSVMQFYREVLEPVVFAAVATANGIDGVPKPVGSHEGPV